MSGTNTVYPMMTDEDKDRVKEIMEKEYGLKFSQDFTEINGPITLVIGEVEINDTSS